MTTDPKSDSVQHTPGPEPEATPSEAEPGVQDASAAAPTPPDKPDIPDAAGEAPKVPQPFTVPGSGATPPIKPATERVDLGKPRSATEIAASFTEPQDGSLDRAVEEAMAGITREELAGDTVELPKDEAASDAIVSGRIANVGSNDVLIDFGGKDLGTMALAEFGKDETISVGDRLEVMILGRDERGGLLKVSRRAARREVILRDMKVGRVLDARVTGMNRGGLEVAIEDLRGFIPASQVDIRFVKDISELIGQKIQAEVTKFDRRDDNLDIVLSRRKVLLREEQGRKEKLFAELEEGQVRRGKVRGLADYGAFVDIGGVDGLLHVRDMSWGRVNKPEDLVKVGDEIDVMVIKVDKEKKRVSLSLKQTVTNPWQDAAEKYTVGAKIQGRVVRLADFGAFVELEPGVDALLPISEMSWTRRVRHPAEIVKEGDIVEVSVLNVDIEKRRISLSLKALCEDPWTTAAQSYVAGTKVQGKVVRTTDFGAFVELEDGIDGLIHISELSDQRIKAVTDKVKPGEQVEVRILAVDIEAKRISLSMRQPPAEPTPEELAKIEAERAAAAKKKSAKPRRGGITFGWDEGLNALDPSRFAP